MDQHKRPKAVTATELTAILAERVMGWGIGQDRFLMSGRGWKPRWKFQPTENLEDAFRLLEAAIPLEYTLRCDRNGIRLAEVRIARGSGKASGRSLPIVICIAVARAYGISRAEIQ